MLPAESLNQLEQAEETVLASADIDMVFEPGMEEKEHGLLVFGSAQSESGEHSHGGCQQSRFSDRHSSKVNSKSTAGSHVRLTRGEKRREGMKKARRESPGGRPEEP
jgi:hypothetical protein